MDLAFPLIILQFNWYHDYLFPLLMMQAMEIASAEKIVLERNSEDTLI